MVWRAFHGSYHRDCFLTCTHYSGTFPPRRDYYLGGKDNPAADREAGDRLIAVFPAVVEAARENRQFLARAVTWAANQGVCQFIDLGRGMPAAPSARETARAVRPDARVAYVENDPVALSRLQTAAAKGTPGVSVVTGDVGDPDAILGTSPRGSIP